MLARLLARLLACLLDCLLDCLLTCFACWLDGARCLYLLVCVLAFMHAFLSEPRRLLVSLFMRIFGLRQPPKNGTCPHIEYVCVCVCIRVHAQVTTEMCSGGTAKP